MIERMRLFAIVLVGMASFMPSPVAIAAPHETATNGDYGICAHLSRPSEFATRIVEMRLMREMGAKWCRTDFDWKNIEPREGEWAFSHLDRLLNDADETGIAILPILNYEVPWASVPWSDEHLPKWREYVHKVVSRYKGRCPVWEVWNEPNVVQENTTHPHPSPREYVKLLRATREIIRAADPAAKVAIGGFAGVPLDYIEAVYLAGGRDTFDIMNVHPYQKTEHAEGKFENEFAALRELMARFGDENKSVWATEIGLETIPMKLNFPGLLGAALRTIDPVRRWRILYTAKDAISLDNARVGITPREIGLRDGSIDFCLFKELPSRLRLSQADALFFPFSEDFPAEEMACVLEFVKAGGTLVEHGGMALFRPSGHGFDRALRFRNAAWFTDRRIPKRFTATPTAAFAGEWHSPVTPGRSHVAGYGEVRCFLPDGLQGNDAFIPLLTAATNGTTCSPLVRIRYDSDMKGNLILSGFFDRAVLERRDNLWQARGLARQMNEAYAMGYSKVFWYEFARMSSFGIVEKKGFRPTPAFKAYRAFVTARPDGSKTLDGKWQSEESDIVAPRWLRPDGSLAGAVWSKTGKGNAPAQVGGASEYRDYLGNRLEALPKVLPTTPIYYVKWRRDFAIASISKPIERNDEKCLKSLK